MMEGNMEEGVRDSTYGIIRVLCIVLEKRRLDR
jgi:hypothetical protein